MYVIIIIIIIMITLNSFSIFTDGRERKQIVLYAQKCVLTPKNLQN